MSEVGSATDRQMHPRVGDNGEQVFGEYVRDGIERTVDMPGFGAVGTGEFYKNGEAVRDPNYGRNQQQQPESASPSPWSGGRLPR